MKKTMIKAMVAGTLFASLLSFVGCVSTPKADPAIKVNVDDEPDLAQAYGISSIPTLILFKDGKAADMMVGLRSKDEIVKWAEG